jgi:hypothetical protein
MRKEGECRGLGEGAQKAFGRRRDTSETATIVDCEVRESRYGDR